MAEFLTTTGISHHIENIIVEAKSKLVLVSPYLKIHKTFYERLKDVSNRGVKIIIIYGKDELKPNERNSLAELKNIELHYFQNLHAKCYFNEKKMVISSMNMHEFSEKNNREMGVLIDKSIDKDIFQKAVDETLSILKSSEEDILIKDNKKSFASKSKKIKTIRGFCIRCEERIDYNPSKPFCEGCFDIWDQYGNDDYEENVCHRCGEYDNVSMSIPQCYTCYNIWRNE